MKKALVLLLLSIGTRAFAADGNLIVNGKLGLGVPECTKAQRRHICRWG